jgi:hypothetical protein
MCAALAFSMSSSSWLFWIEYWSQRCCKPSNARAISFALEEKKWPNANHISQQCAALAINATRNNEVL